MDAIADGIDAPTGVGIGPIQVRVGQVQVHHHQEAVLDVVEDHQFVAEQHDHVRGADEVLGGGRQLFDEPDHVVAEHAHGAALEARQVRYIDHGFRRDLRAQDIEGVSTQFLDRAVLVGQGHAVSVRHQAAGGVQSDEAVAAEPFPGLGGLQQEAGLGGLGSLD